MVEIRRQPPDDSGSRKNLKEKRKGDIDKVDHAYSGIVNVYALLPPNSGAITLGKFTGGVIIEKQTKSYKQPEAKPAYGEQTKESKETKKQNRIKSYVAYNWDSTRPEGLGLYPMEMANGALEFVKGGPKANYNTYEEQLSKNPKLINNRSDKDPEILAILEAIHLRGYKNNNLSNSKYKNDIFRAAQNLQISTKTLNELYKINYKGKSNITEESFEKQVFEEPVQPVEKPIVKEVKEYPIPLKGLHELFESTTSGYIPIDKDENLLSIDKSRLAFKRLPSGDDVIYYTKITERHKHLKRVGIKRVIYRLKKLSGKKLVKTQQNKSKIIKKVIKVPIKLSRSSDMKKNILNKLRCVCRRK